MRYTSALVLSTLAVAEAAGHNARHASFHARRQAEVKRNPGQYDNLPVDWSKLSYDLSGVNWSSVFASQKGAATPTPEAQEQPAYVAPAQETSTPAPQAPSAPAYTPAPTPTPKPSSAEAAQPSQSQGQSYSGDNDFSKGLSAFFGKLGVNTDSCNSESSNNQIWLGKSSQWRAKFVNGGGEGIYMTCWSKNQGGQFSGMSINSQPPLIAGYLAPGAEQYVSFAQDFPAACAPLTLSTAALAIFGGVQNTWWEATFGPSGAFDVSRNVDMHGTNIHSKGSKCTSDMDTCVFKCSSDVASCETGYDLFNCGADSGGGGGYDKVMQGTGGGCAMGASGEEVTVTFS